MPNSSSLSSQYKNTPINGWYLDRLVPRVVPKNEFDKILVIPAAFDQRPDLLSYQEYGTPGLWWIFAVRNPDILIDPINDFISGIEIYVPVDILKQ